MKRGSEYAKRVKKLFQQLIQKHGRPAQRELTDPIEQLVMSILSACTSYEKARAVYDKLFEEMVDLNELRVTPPMELVQIFGQGFPLARAKARQIVDALNAVRKRQDALDLSFLKQRGRREAREYLESLDGVDPATAAGVVLNSLGGHAIPVDNLTLYVLRKEEIVNGDTDLAGVQSFLERNISATDARAFVELLNKFVTAKGARVPVDKLPQLLNPPPPEPPKKTAKKEKPEPKTTAKAGDQEEKKASKKAGTSTKKKVAAAKKSETKKTIKQAAKKETQKTAREKNTAKGKANKPKLTAKKRKK